MKRVGLFLLVNMLVLTTIIIVTSILGVGRYVSDYGIDYYALIIFAAVVGFSGAFISLFLSKWMAKSMMNVEVIDPERSLTRQQQLVLDLVYRLARDAGMQKMPEVGIYPSEEVNAFATGYSQNNSLVAVSQGLLNRMKPDELEGVLAHEVAHIVNGDMVTMTLIQGVINTFVVFLSRILAHAASLFVKRELQEIVHFALILVFQILLSILGSLVVLAFSRRREFSADADGARLAGKEKMISALRSLQRTTALVDNKQESLAAFKISGSKKGGFRRLFSTHPDLDERISRLGG